MCAVIWTDNVKINMCLYHEPEIIEAAMGFLK